MCDITLTVALNALESILKDKEYKLTLYEKVVIEDALKVLEGLEDGD